MRFICLHGAGTNSKIFEMQTAALRHELGGDHTYDFVEGIVPHPKAPGIDNFATAEHGYFAYYTPHEAESFRTALHDLKKYIETDGPFDGLIAFSQGTALASAFLMEQLSSIGDGGRFRQPFQCAIFLCGRPPFLDTGFQPPGPVAGEDRGEKLISIPTVHIWGSTDYVDPGQALALSALCGPQNTYVYIHPGGHEVPGPRDKVALINSANSIRRMLTVV